MVGRVMEGELRQGIERNWPKRAHLRHSPCQSRPEAGTPTGVKGEKKFKKMIRYLSSKPVQGALRVKQAQDRLLDRGKFQMALGRQIGVFPEGGLPRPTYRDPSGARVWVFG